jgi:hypothetical protein
MSQQDQHFEIYKLSVEMADRLSGRRAVANSFFISLETALTAAFGFWIGGEETLSIRKTVTMCLVATTISTLWWMQVTSYRNLSSAKFKVIHELEQNLVAAPYKNEWALIKHERKWHLDISQIERFIPLVYLIVNLSLILSAVK